MYIKDKTQTTIQRENKETIKFGYMPAKSYHSCEEKHGYVFYIDNLNPATLELASLDLTGFYFYWMHQEFRAKALYEWLSIKSAGYIDLIQNGTDRLSLDMFKLACRYCNCELQYRDRKIAVQKIEEHLCDKLPQYAKTNISNN